MKLLSDLSSQWAVINRLLDEALALDPSQHEAWLERLAPEHHALKGTLRGLLAAQAGIETQAFLDTLPRMSEPATDLKAGDEIGPYRILERIGSGGQGSVWLAQRADGQLKRKLALKLPQLAWAEGLAARMERERDILGALDHPHIARLYDAGVDQRGRPFLAIEYIEGVSLDRHCDEQRLDVRARVALFMKILEAVQYAHTSLVVHRDLKPANVLVNAKGDPKLLDFGVSSLMEQAGVEGEDAAAQTSTRAMTPRYASPEQMEGRRLGVGSDVYSLGVMLHELLSGCSPYGIGRGSVREYEEAILAGKVRSPSRSALDGTIAEARDTTPKRLARQLQGDLDAVVLKALARDPRERYGSALALHDDLRRWSTGRAVQARPPSAWVSLRKFLVRNRWIAGGVTAAVAAVAVAGLVAVQQAKVAREEARRANATRDFVMGIFNDANPALHAGRDVTVRELLSANEDKLIDRLSGDPSLQADVLHSVAQVWDRFGDWGRVVEIHDKRAGLLGGNGASPDAVAAALLEQGQALAVVNRLQDIPPLLDRVRVLSPVEGMPDDLRERYEWLRGWVALNVGERREARAHFGRALEAARRTGDTGAQVRALYGRSASETFVNRVASDRDRAAALRDHREAARLLESSSLDRLQRHDQWYQLLANLFWLGEYREGWSLTRRQMVEADQLFGEYAPASARLQFFYPAYLWRLGRPQEALDWLAARERHRRRSDALQAPPPTTAREAALESRLWTALGRQQEARAVIDRWRGANPDPSMDDQLRVGLAELERSQSFADADEVLRLLSQKPWNTLTGEDDSEWPLYPLWHRGLALERQGDQESALPLLEAAVRKAQDVMGVDHPRVALVRMSLAFARWRGGWAEDPAKRPVLVAQMGGVVADLERAMPADVPSVQEARVFLAHLRGAPATEESLDRWRNPQATFYP
ncbi:MAG: protein kinase domain-containing protein [Gammaproteobacteria bacterium]